MQIKRYNETNNLRFIGAVASFPAVVKPKLNTADPKPENHFYEFTVDILIPKDTDMTDYETVKAQVEADRWGNKVPEFRYPALKDGDKKFTRDGEPYEGYPGNWYITAKASADNQPRVIDMAKNIMERVDAIIGGDIVNVFVSVYAYGTAGNNGIGYGLTAIQLREKTDKPFGGGVSKNKAADAFDEFNDLDDFSV